MNALDLRRNRPALAALGLALLLLIGLILGSGTDRLAIADDDDNAEVDPYDAALDGKEKLEGYFTLYHGDNQLLAALSSGDLDRPFICMSSIARGIASGRFVNGTTLGTQILAFTKRTDDSVVLMRKNVRFIENGSTPLGHAVDIAFSDSPIALLPVVASRGSTVLVDLGRVFLNDFNDVRSSLSRLGTSYRLNDELSSFASVKNFPGNTELRASLVFLASGRGDGSRALGVADTRGVDVLMHYSLAELPDSDYTPRRADDRVGFFTTVLYDFARPEAEGFIRYINRWNLEKADPSLAASPAKEPVVFWIENTVPFEYRPYIRQALMAWNRAYAAAGILDAIECRQMPDNATWDPEDARYNTIRWTAAYTMGYAIGPSRTNPLTGEILDADILIDANFVRGFESSYRLRHEAGFGFGYGTTGGDEHVVTPDELRNPPILADAGPDLDMSQVCLASQGLSQSAAIAGLAAALDGRVTVDDDGLPPDYIGTALRDLVMHEVGHTLGLRHNFRASTLRTIEELKDDAIVETGGFAASVMDYLPVFVTAEPETQGYYHPPDIGPYDVWAIRYGYSNPVSGSKTEWLESILDECTRPEHIYGTDEDAYGAFGIDPYCRVWDAGSEPLDYVRERYSLVKNLLARDWQGLLVSEPEGRVVARRAFHTLVNEHARATYQALDFIGGIRHFRHHADDPGSAASVVPVSREVMDAALTLLIDNSLTPDSFSIPAGLIQQLSPDRWGHWGYDPTSNLNNTLFNNLMVEKRAVLGDLHYGPTLARLQEISLMDPNALTPAEILTRVTDTVWAGLDTGEAISALHRAVQTEHASLLIGIWLDPPAGYPTEARMLARTMLRRIEATLGNANVGEDLASQAHVEGTRDLIRTTLAAVATVNPD